MPHRIDEDLRTKGFDPEQIKRQIKGHIENTFGGNVQSYAKAIESKKPEQLTDPRAAEALRMLAPGMFKGAPKPPGHDPQRPGVMSFNFGHTAPLQQGSGIHPSALAALNAIGSYQQANPFTLPVAPGTKMRWQLQDEEAMRAQAAAEALRQEQWGLEQEKWDWQKQQADLDRQLAERKFAADQAYRNAQLAAAAKTQASQGTPWGNVDLLISMGASLDDVLEYVNNPANYASYKSSGVTLEQMQDYAMSKYSGTWESVKAKSAPSKGASLADQARSLRQAEAASMRLSDLEALKSSKATTFTEADYAKFAADTQKPIEEIRWLDSQGWLDGFMKTFYGQEYKDAGGETVYSIP